MLTDRSRVYQLKPINIFSHDELDRLMKFLEKKILIMLPDHNFKLPYKEAL